MDFTVSLHLQKAISFYKQHDYELAVQAAEEAKSIIGAFCWPEDPVVLHLDAIFILSSVEIVHKPDLVLNLFLAHFQINDNRFIHLLMSYDKVLLFQFTIQKIFYEND